MFLHELDSKTIGFSVKDIGSNSSYQKFKKNAGISDFYVFYVHKLSVLRRVNNNPYICKYNKVLITTNFFKNYIIIFLSNLLVEGNLSSSNWSKIFFVSKDKPLLL